VTWAWPFRRGSRPDRDVPWVPPELGDPEGLIGVGGDLSPDLLLRAYAEGVFPWFSEGDPVLWWSPDPRAVIELDGLHVSRRLARTIRSGKFRVTVDQRFDEVMRACGENRPEGTWVTEEMIAGYSALHRLGHAHSLEVWAATPIPPGPLDLGVQFTSWDDVAAGMSRAALHGWELVGGIYGVAVGGLFAGESMFHRKTDASKVALVSLVERLKQRGYVLFDVQMTTEHTERMGAVNIPRDEYLRRLHAAVRMTGVTFV
jgi:leucyl/phenylalanyl-tRNA--protein transferase